MEDKSEVRELLIVHKQQTELLKKLIEINEKNNEFSKRYSYITFCLASMAYAVALTAFIFTVMQQAQTLAGQLIIGLLFTSMFMGGLWFMFSHLEKNY